MLWLLSLVYAATVGIVKFLHRVKFLPTHYLNTPVISVGNLTVGGVGKTPLVISIVEFLRREGIRPAVLLRGYMDPGSRNSTEVPSDEAAFLRESLGEVPVLVGADRIRNAKSLPAEAVDVFILDDGFQHWKLGRQLDIVAIDATNPFGNGHVLPRGILREPPQALSQADFFVITKADLGQNNVETISDKLKSIAPDTPVAHARHQPVAFIDLRKNETLPLSFMEGKKACAVCSIGDPHSYLNTLKGLGVQVEKNFTFMDHYNYRQADISQVEKFCHSNEIKFVVMTQKDAVKVRPLLKDFDADIRFLTLKIAMDFIKGQEMLFQNILTVVSKPGGLR